MAATAQMPPRLSTGDAYKDEVQNQWNEDPCGAQYVKEAQPDTLEWFLEVERYRYDVYAPWMREVMEFDRHRGEKLLEIGAGIGTDHAQFAKGGALVHDLDLAGGHLQLAMRNFEVRGLKGSFHHGDAENIPFDDNTFNVVYSNGVIHHTPNTRHVVGEIYRVLKPGGRCIIMVYAENSLHYWRILFHELGIRRGMLQQQSMGDIMSANVELSEHGQKPLVKVYTARRLRQMFSDFEKIHVYKRQMVREELPARFAWFPLDLAGRLAGWNLIIKARKPRNAAAVSHRGSAARASAVPAVSAPAAAAFDREVSRAGTDVAGWIEKRRTQQRQYSEAAIAHVARLRGLFPDMARGTVAAAEGFLAHRFDLLGSGPFTPRDPDRPERDGYQPIDWYLDPVRDLRFPRGVPYKEWKLFEMRPGDADVKYPWELARCQHWMTLAQAWRVSGEARFAIEIARELDDFVEANPVGIGVNWTCTMDVAIRAANWCLALSLLHDCAALDAAFWGRALRAMFDHARFIFDNLENNHEVTSNHYLSNVCGLFVLAAEFADLPAGHEWLAWCRNSLETEMTVQVHEEGTDFESSIPYHRLVAELFLSGARLARLQGAPLTPEFEARLVRMATFLLDTMRPDGLMPVVGDCDDGRFHIFTRTGDWNPQDARHLLAAAGALFERRDWLAAAGEAGAWEAAWWGFDPAPVAAVPRAPLPAVARLYPEFGVAVARGTGALLAVTNGKVGTCGFGNHKHNELLGFEYHCGGRAVIVDPGSFGYTGDFAARNLFRGTAYHNTLEVDSVEQNEVNPEWIFRMFEKADPEHLAFADDGEWVCYRGRHHGYERLDQPVTHEREFRFNRASGLLLIEDRLSGTGEHALRWHFHIAPDVSVDCDEPDAVLAGDGQRLLLASDPGLGRTTEASWYSPSYGVRLPAQSLRLTAIADVGQGRTYRFAIGPEAAVCAWRGSQRHDDESAVARARV
jgi:ubiquinone/menaquinone biosynthesis C-methylase UbiE